LLWASKPIHVDPKTGAPYLKRGDGVTVRRIIDRHGNVGYCPDAEYEKLRQREMVAMLEMQEQKLKEAEEEEAKEYEDSRSEID
jgi:hypothetical protein